MLKIITGIFRVEPVALSEEARDLLASVEPGVYDAGGRLRQRYGEVYDWCKREKLLTENGGSWQDDDLIELTRKGRMLLTSWSAR